MPRATLPGRNGRAVPNDSNVHVLHPHLHRITLTELDLELPPSDTRTFSGATSDEKRAQQERRRANWLAVLQALAGIIGFAAILALLAPHP